MALEDTRKVWVVRTLAGGTVEICPGAKEPYLQGVVGEVSYRVARKLGFIGLGKGKSKRYEIVVREC